MFNYTIIPIMPS